MPHHHGNRPSQLRWRTVGKPPPATPILSRWLSASARAGYADGLRVITRAAWLQPVPANAGVVVYGTDEQSDARGC